MGELLLGRAREVGMRLGSGIRAFDEPACRVVERMREGEGESERGLEGKKRKKRGRASERVSVREGSDVTSRSNGGKLESGLGGERRAGGGTCTWC